MNVRDWLDLADKYCLVISELTTKANEKSSSVDKLIISISEQVSNQWISTHDKAIDQIENGLKTQGKLITTQYDVILNNIFLSLNHLIKLVI